MHADRRRPYRPRNARLELVFTRPPVRHGDGFNLLPAIQAVFHKCAALRSCGIPACTRAEMRVGSQDGGQSGHHLAASARLIEPSNFYMHPSAASANWRCKGVWGASARGCPDRSRWMPPRTRRRCTRSTGEACCTCFACRMAARTASWLGPARAAPVRKRAGSVLVISRDPTDPTRTVALGCRHSLSNSRTPGLTAARTCSRHAAAATSSAAPAGP